MRYLPEQIARAVRQNPEGMEPQLGLVKALLEHQDPTVRFGAACALAEWKGGQDPDILKGLAAGLVVSEQYRLYREVPSGELSEAVRHLMAVETLERMGPRRNP